MLKEQIFCSRRCEYCRVWLQVSAIAGSPARAEAVETFICNVDNHKVGKEVTQGMGLGIETSSPEGQLCTFPEQKG